MRSVVERFKEDVAMLFHESPSQYKRLPRMVLASTSDRSASVSTFEVPKPKELVAAGVHALPFQTSRSPHTEPGVLASVEVA